VFTIKYDDAGSVSVFIEDKSLRDVIMCLMCHQVKLMKSMSFVGNPVLCNVCCNVFIVV